MLFAAAATACTEIKLCSAADAALVVCIIQPAQPWVEACVSNHHIHVTLMFAAGAA
jgi:hypothetical protein